MKQLDRLEKRFGRLAVPNLVPAIVIGQVAVYALAALQDARGRGPAALDVDALVQLRPDLVLRGQVWRVVTFLFEPPRYSLIFLLLHWYVLWFIGQALEQMWGAFRLTLYLLVGYAATVAVAFFLPPGMATNAYLYSSLFLAFASLYPDFVFHIYFVLPMKAKWLAAITWAVFALRVFTGGWPVFWLVLATVADYLLFFGYGAVKRLGEARRRQEFRAKAERAAKPIVHECRVCGLTNQMAPRTAFRYCSKCAGQQCYCPDHLGNHEHVV
ncbi:hypothetical protein [Botrimarina sp.]|uniref:hypothetical protein n=1 Tax=Botrimarina sp. TaxID=2795802 RepID=UPI0032EE9A55